MFLWSLNLPIRMDCAPFHVLVLHFWSLWIFLRFHWKRNIRDINMAPLWVTIIQNRIFEATVGIRKRTFIKSSWFFHECLTAEIQKLYNRKMFITHVEPLINNAIWNKHDYWPILRPVSTYPEIRTNPDLKLIHSWVKVSLILIPAKLLHPWYFLNLRSIQKLKIWHILPA